jgi:putative transposase
MLFEARRAGTRRQAGQPRLSEARPGFNGTKRLQARNARHTTRPTMGQSLSQVTVHVIFSTKARQPFIAATFRQNLHSYLAGLCVRFECVPFAVDGVSDHVHMLVGLHKTMSVSAFVEKIKSNSSGWVKRTYAPNFAWQNGYGAFSVSESLKAKVIHYIANQEERHKTVTFQEELRAFLQQHGTAYDEKYVWD